MLTSEVDSALGPRDVWQQRAELARLVVGARATGPLVVVPALRHATLEMIPHAGVDRVHVFEGEVDALAFRHCRNTAGVQADRRGPQDAPRSRLTVRHVP